MKQNSLRKKFKLMRASITAVLLSFGISIGGGVTSYAEISNETESKEESWTPIDHTYEQNVKNGITNVRAHTYAIRITEVFDKEGKLHKLTNYECLTCNDKVSYEFTPWVYDKNTNTDSRVCVVTGYKETRGHVHEPSVMTEVTENLEKGYCSCGMYVEASHTLDYGTVLENGSGFFHCLNLNCNHTSSTPSYTPPVYGPGVKCIYIPGSTPSMQSGVSSSKGSSSRGGSSSGGGGGSSHGGSSFHTSSSHTHDYTKLVRIDDFYEYWECEKDGNMKTVPHQIKVTENEKEKITTCINPGCHYKKVEVKHQHQFQHFVNKDEFAEYYQCECGEITQKEHSFDKGYIDKSTHEVVKTCQNPECGYIERKEHNHEYDTYIDTDGVEETWECSACGKTMKAPHNHDFDIFVSGEDEQETWKCTKDNETTLKNHNLKQKEIDRETHEVVYECTTDGCSYEKREEHDHHFDHRLSLNRVSETWECSECGKTEVRDHEHTYELDEDSIDPNELETWQCECGEKELRLHAWKMESSSGGVVTQVCENCGVTRDHHTCVKGNKEVIQLHNEEGCYKTIYKCKVCGEIVSEEITPHRFILDERNHENICRRCQYREPVEEISIKEKVAFNFDKMEVNNLKDTFKKETVLEKQEDSEISKKVEDEEETNLEIIDVPEKLKENKEEKDLKEKDENKEEFEIENVLDKKEEINSETIEDSIEPEEIEEEITDEKETKNDEELESQDHLEEENEIVESEEEFIEEDSTVWHDEGFENKPFENLEEMVSFEETEQLVLSLKKNGGYRL